VTPVAAVVSAWSASLASISSAEATAGVGIDLVEMTSFAELHAAGGQAFLDNGWTPTEQQDAGGSVERLAARWAAKEAVMKALGCGLGDLDPLDVEIAMDSRGAPYVSLHQNALTAASSRTIHRWHISLCHESGWAAAIAIAERRHSGSESTHQDEGNEVA
jgi:holo-[acyl-carrier protein] synthase